MLANIDYLSLLVVLACTLTPVFVMWHLLKLRDEHARQARMLDDILVILKSNEKRK